MIVDGAVGHVKTGQWAGCYVVVLIYRATRGDPLAWEFRFSDIDVGESPPAADDFEVLKYTYADALDFMNSLDVAWCASDQAEQLRRSVFKLRGRRTARLARWASRFRR